jgi:hypothetical protein
MRASCRIALSVAASGVADYHSRMPEDARQEMGTVERSVAARRVALRAVGSGDADLVVHDARGREIERIEMRPSLFAALHRPFSLGAGERLAARALLALLRLPGGARLLRAWHAGRSR